MTKIYRKTTTVNAEQFDGSDEMIDKYNIKIIEGDYADDYSMPEAGPAPYVCYFLTRFDVAKGISVGDWIATGVNGEHWSISDDVFKKTYAELPVIPYYVNDYINHMKLSYRDIWDAMRYPFRSDKIDKYMEDNSETFARAWLDGYVMEEDE